MHEHYYEGGDPRLLLPSLRLLVPPLRLVSAAIWQTIQQKVVADYGLLEEFISMTTDIVPELLNPNQRAQLLLGLRARLILEHCQSEPADLQTIQPHLDRMQILMAICRKEATNAEEGLSRSNFLGLILTLLKDPDERQCFFQDVFPVEFGLKYDRAIQTLVWQFLSRLEKLLPVPKLQEVASLLGDAPSVLEECVGSVSDVQELKFLLEYQKNLSQLDDNDSESPSCGECVLRALSLPPVEKVVNLNEQTATGTQVESTSEDLKVGNAAVKASTEMGLSSCIGEIVQMQQSRTEDYGGNNKQYPVHIVDLTENDGDTAEYLEDTEPVSGEQVTLKERDTCTINSNGDIWSKDIKSEDSPEMCETLIVRIGEDRTAEALGVMASIEKGNVILKSPLNQAKQQRKTQDLRSMPTLLLPRSERPNRGLKMKTFLAQERKPVKMQLPESNNNQPPSLDSDVGQHQQVGTKQQKYQCLRCGKCLQSNLNLKRHMHRACTGADKTIREFKCTACGKTFLSAAGVKCHMISHSNERPYQCSNCERSFKHVGSMKAHEEACLFASQQRREVSSGESGSTTAMGENNFGPLESFPHQTSPGETSELLHNVKQAPSPAKTLQHDAEIFDPFSSTFQVLPEPKTSDEQQEQNAVTSLHSLTHSTCSKTIQRSKEMIQHRMTPSSDVIYNCTNCQKTYKYLKNFQKHKELCKKGTNQNRDENEPEASNEIIQELSAERGESVSGVAIETSHVDSSVKTSSNQLHPSGTELESSRGNNVMDGKTSHTRHLSKVNPLSCPRCGINFETRNGWLHHITQICKVQSVKPSESLRQVGIKKSRKCDECGKEFGLRSTLRAHKLTHNPLYCAECGKVCPDAETLAVHNVMHRPVRCTMCDKSFNVVRFLIKHYLDAHDFSGPFVCTHCCKSYSELGALIRHERTHTGDLPFHCTKCPKRFNRHIDLVSHERTHTGEKRFLCWECGRTFTTNELLKKHMERHSGQQKRFSCPLCKRTFRAKRAVNAHFQIHHKGMRFPCSYCGKLFLSRSALGRHDLIHTGEKPFTCAFKGCTKSFRSNAELRIHVRYHTGERPFKCQICEKGFVQANYLTIHLRSHTQERPYACPNCERRFTSGNLLNRHKLVHTGEKPFRCEVCDEGFNRRHRLKTHKDKYHK
uniref:uncharacterized protein n=1 Tax=Centroberyx gerrardi TaxID=166262 RepID=UPI003AB06A4D